jgi:hypothetical protein
VKKDKKENEPGLLTKDINFLDRLIAKDNFDVQCVKIDISGIGKKTMKQIYIYAFVEYLK